MDRTIGSDVKHQLFVVGFLLNTVVFDSIFNVLYRCVDRIDRYHTNISVRVFIFFAGYITTALVYSKLDFKRYRSVHVANNEVRVQNSKVVRELGDVASPESILSIDDYEYLFAVARLTALFKPHLFQVQYNFGNVFNNAFDGRKFVHHARKTNRCDCETFE